jgi:FkbM family methyltransferase
MRSYSAPIRGMKLADYVFSEPRGASFQDNFILLLLRLGYWGTRLGLRFLLGKRRRDNFFITNNLDFSSFLYRSLKFFAMHESIVLQMHAPKYDYQFYCRANRDDFLFMTNHETEILEQHFVPNEGDVVVDVGAHIGQYTILASRHVGLTGQVISIEPEPRNFEILKRNISLNQLHNVKPVACAAYSSHTKTKLFLPEEESGRTIYNTVIKERAGTNGRYVEVDAATLDSILESVVGVSKVNWIKIDVEGAELEVLRGTCNILAESNKVRVLVEIHSVSLYKDVSEYLKSLKFRIIYEKRNELGNWGHILAEKL